jgi:hypothetical protein
MLQNKIILLPNYDELNEYLKNELNYNYNCPSFYNDRIAITTNYKNKNSIRIWKTFSILDIWYSKFVEKNIIGALDYSIHDTFIKIDYLFINDEEKLYMNYNFFLNEDDAEKLVHSFILYIKDIAKKENKNKIIIDVHNNLRYYNKYYKDEGFCITKRKSKDNPFWIETEINS